MHTLFKPTFKAFRRGRKKYLIEATWIDFKCWVWVTLYSERLVEAVEMRLDAPETESLYPVPFANVPPMARAMARAVVAAAASPSDFDALA